VRLRPWRLTELQDVAVMIDDECLRPWSTIGADLDGWIRREAAQSLVAYMLSLAPEAR
jgi:hypothetical protein